MLNIIIGEGRMPYMGIRGGSLVITAGGGADHTGKHQVIN